MTENESTTPTNYIRDIIDEDIRSGKYGGRVQTRFPPEPNGFTHIGHAKSICLNFGIAKDYGGIYTLRFDDTNPLTEEQVYIDAIQEDIRWLGFDWGENLRFASDYFEQLYELTIQLIQDGEAYVDDLSQEQIREYRGTLTEPGKNSPYRERSVEENLDLFERMRAGEFENGARVLRMKIDMTSGNMNMRDPILYRILHASHPRSGDKWCIYPMYDWAHGQCDALEGVTHSICTLEFEDHRPLYDHFLDKLDLPPQKPQQIEFARLNLSYTIMSKRRLLILVNDGHVNGWDDPRMPTLSGLRRRGYPPEVIRTFMDLIGVAKTNSVVDIALLEHVLRQNLEVNAQRTMAVLDPLKVVIENYPEGQDEAFEVPHYPQDTERKETRIVPFSRELYIEREDFMEDPPGKFFRLAPGREVRLLNAYYITCSDVVKDENGEITELRCTYDPETRGGMSSDGRRVKGTLHWVSAEHAIPAEVHLYEHLFTKPNPYEVEEGQDFTSNLNPNSLTILTGCRLEPALRDAKVGSNYQFMRKGYFVIDSLDSTPDQLVFNRTVSLRDTWAKLQKKTQ
ncbi:MAG: glutamine--tRNA ligase/YqeY domain fusion protein [Anaerolineaceae bacterium]|nr:glutamine--tRNA ligase/YqeY domain fusion protein [Anaerolineaceae bacterium]